MPGKGKTDIGKVEKIIANNIKDVRADFLQVNQSVIAKRYGISNSQVSKLENHAQGKPETAFALMDFCYSNGINLNWLFGITTNNVYLNKKDQYKQVVSNMVEARKFLKISPQDVAKAIKRHPQTVYKFERIAQGTISTFLSYFRFLLEKNIPQEFLIRNTSTSEYIIVLKDPDADKLQEAYIQLQRALKEKGLIT